MNKFCKVLAVVLAVLMLVTMATACKKSDEDDWEIMNNEGSSIGEENENENNEPSGNGSSSTVENENENENNSGTNNSGNEGNSGTNNSGNENNASNNNSETNEGDGEEAPSIEQVVQDYDASKKYDVESNPLLAENKPINTGVAPSFDLDTTGFVKNNVKLADLKGKTFTLITAIGYGAFSYDGPNGETLDEWTWFKALKEEYGLNIKYIESRFTESVNQALTYMNAGKALDLIPTHIGGFPQFLNISQPLDPYINLQNINNSPGVDTMTLEQTRYGGGYRCISGIGIVDVLWYDQSRVEEMGLEDPHTLWQKDEWDWDAWRDFITSCEKTTSTGMKIAACAISGMEASWAWPLSDGINTIEIDTKSDEMNLINNWNDERVIRAITYFSDAYKSVQNGADLGLGGGGVLMVGDVLIGETVVLMNNYDERDDYAANHQVNWVPYPKSPYDTGRYVAYNFGYTMMLPKKIKTQSNAPLAVKFMELWATRFTEAMFDYMTTTKFLQFNYEQKKEFFEFCIDNTYFGLQMNSWRFLGEADKAAMLDSQSGYFTSITNRNLNVATQHAKVANVVEKAIKECVEFAQ